MAEQAPTAQPAAPAAGAPEQVAGTITTASPAQPTVITGGSSIAPVVPDPNAPPATGTEDPNAPDFTPKFAALAREEKKVRGERDTLKQEREAHQTELAELKAFKDAKAAAQADPTLLFDQFGIKSEDVIKAALAKGEAPTADTKVAELEAKVAAVETARAQDADAAKKAGEDAEVNKYKSDVVAYVKTEPEKYEAIKIWGAEQDVADLIVTAWERDGLQLQVDEAAQKIEDYLVEQAQKSTQLSKLKPATAPLASIPRNGQSTQQPTTLTNANGGHESVPVLENGLKVMSRQASLDASAKKIEAAWAQKSS